MDDVQTHVYQADRQKARLIARREGRKELFLVVIIRVRAPRCEGCCRTQGVPVADSTGMRTMMMMIGKVSKAGFPGQKRGSDGLD